MAGPILPFLGGLASTVAPGLVMGGAQAALGGVGTRKQYHRSKKLAAWQNELNKQFLDYQNLYNSPKAQMERFAEAGLNPHLAISGGNPGNMAQAQRAADYPNMPDMGFLSTVMPMVNQSAMTAAQVQATNARTMQVGVLADLQRQQTELIKRNPLFSDTYLNSIVDSFKSMASIKSTEAWRGQNLRSFEETQGFGKYAGSANLGQEKMWRELELLDQKYNLGASDLKIKAQVLQSKEFQNDIMEIQRRWMVDGDITPQLIYQFLSSFFLKLTP